MVLTPSTMLDIGTQAPAFSLPDVISNHTVELANFTDQALLVVFSCNHCPYVLHILESFTEFARESQYRDLAIVMINSNDISRYPADSPEKMATLAQRLDFNFPYLYDQSQQVALDYRAACTPDFFLFDAAHRLVYRGQYDGSRPGNSIAVDGGDLKSAVNALLTGAEISTIQIPSVGCSIKWCADREPNYV